MDLGTSGVFDTLYTIHLSDNYFAQFFCVHAHCDYLSQSINYIEKKRSSCIHQGLNPIYNTINYNL